MAEYEYKITISKDEKPQGGNSAPSLNNEAKTTNAVVKSVSPNIEKRPSSISSALVMNYGKQVAMYTLSNVGKYAGDSKLQLRVNNAIQGISLGILAVKHPVIAALSASVSIGQTIAEETFRRKQERAALSVSRARNGYTDQASVLTSRRH